MAHDLQGESPLTTCQEEGLVKDNGVVARRGRKEVQRESTGRCTRTGYEVPSSLSAMPCHGGALGASGHMTSEVLHSPSGCEP